MLWKVQKRPAGAESTIDITQHQLRNPRGDGLLCKKSPIRARVPVWRKPVSGRTEILQPSDQLELTWMLCSDDKST